MSDKDLKIGRRGAKPPLQWIPMWALQGVARVFDYGARKYRPGNWQRAASDGAEALCDYLSAAQRHWAAMQDEDEGGVASWSAVDSESGLPHIDHLICSLLMARGIGVKAGLLAADPGRGLEPVPLAPAVEAAESPGLTALGLVSNLAVRLGKLERGGAGEEKAPTKARWPNGALVTCEHCDQRPASHVARMDGSAYDFCEVCLDMLQRNPKHEVTDVTPSGAA